MSRENEVKNLNDKINTNSKQETRVEVNNVQLEVELKRWQGKYADLKKEYEKTAAMVAGNGKRKRGVYDNADEQMAEMERAKIAELQ